MKYLLDTGAWLRGYFEPDSIPDQHRRILANPRETFGLSPISLWEVGKKHQLGKLDLGRDLAGWFRDAMGGNVDVLPLAPEVVVDAMGLPAFPNRDPADELIVATARVHGLTVITTDPKLRRYRHAKISYFRPLGTTAPAPETPARRPATARPSAGRCR